MTCPECQSTAVSTFGPTAICRDCGHKTTTKAGYKNGHRPGGYNRTECPVTNRIEYTSAGACTGCGQDVR